jgi:hypothetical protein
LCEVKAIWNYVIVTAQSRTFWLGYFSDFLESRFPLSFGFAKKKKKKRRGRARESKQRNAKN